MLNKPDVAARILEALGDSFRDYRYFGRVTINGYTKGDDKLKITLPSKLDAERIGKAISDILDKNSRFSVFASVCHEEPCSILIFEIANIGTGLKNPNLISVIVDQLEEAGVHVRTSLRTVKPTTPIDNNPALDGEALYGNVVFRNQVGQTKDRNAKPPAKSTQIRESELTSATPSAFSYQTEILSR